MLNEFRRFNNSYLLNRAEFIPPPIKRATNVTWSLLHNCSIETVYVGHKTEDENKITDQNTRILICMMRLSFLYRTEITEKASIKKNKRNCKNWSWWHVSGEQWLNFSYEMSPLIKNLFLANEGEQLMLVQETFCSHYYKANWLVKNLVEMHSLSHW